MSTKIGFILILTVCLFGITVIANDCYSCISVRDVDSAAWHALVWDNTFARLERRPSNATQSPNCSDSSDNLPTVYCRSRCVKEYFKKSSVTYVARYCMDSIISRQKLAYSTGHQPRLFERDVNVNVGLGDMRADACTNSDVEGAHICICHGHLCNEAATVSKISVLVGIFVSFASVVFRVFWC